MEEAIDMMNFFMRFTKR